MKMSSLFLHRRFCCRGWQVDQVKVSQVRSKIKQGAAQAQAKAQAHGMGFGWHAWAWTWTWTQNLSR